ncbi:MAG: hypothetical protein A2Z97_13035 [Bdellovibrionales bacterium GWB1_52_6]|nr:MAG: hypothetical protein A2Z97_13035 [Bdellovibrionales bacterium GWB1_52_6]
MAAHASDIPRDHFKGIELVVADFLGIFDDVIDFVAGQADRPRGQATEQARFSVNARGNIAKLCLMAVQAFTGNAAMIEQMVKVSEDSAIDRAEMSRYGGRAILWRSRRSRCRGQGPATQYQSYKNHCGRTECGPKDDTIWILMTFTHSTTFV